VFILGEGNTTVESQAQENERKLQERKFQFVEVKTHISQNRNWERGTKTLWIPRESKGKGHPRTGHKGPE